MARVAAPWAHARHHREVATRLIRGALIAAMNVRPRDPGLTEEELREVVVGRDGVGEGAFRDALQGLHEPERDAGGGWVVRGRDVSMLMTGHIVLPDDIRPREALNALATAFDEVANTEGSQAAAPRTMLYAKCPAAQPQDIDRALALLKAQTTLKETPEGFVRTRSWPKFTTTAGHGPTIPIDRVVDPARMLLQPIRDVFARRTGAHAPSDPPTERFGRFLLKQGWTGFGSWWAQTLRELHSIGNAQQPTSTCVLCGSLLEAALVAIAKPAKDASQWRQKFLNESADKWKFGALIDQAKESGTFTGDQHAHAITLMNARNRIHAGKFAAGDTFAPPYAEVHEARHARDQLELLIGAILDWPTIRVLT